MKENVVFEKSKSFALRIIKLYKYLCDEKNEYVMSKQLLRCGTSIGANIAESVYAQSNADFIHKLSISLKEASETNYWLEILVEGNIVSLEQVKDLITECIEIIKLLTSSINKLKQKID